MEAGERSEQTRGALERLQRELERCRRCPKMTGPAVHGPPLLSTVYLLGQAPGPREGALGRPFAWTAGKTLFRWLHQALGATEAQVRQRVYFAAVARCFPGKANGGGDRKPDGLEIERCRTFIEREVHLLAPRLVIPVGALAIEQVLGHAGRLAEVVGRPRRGTFHGRAVEVIALPHPSGASTWHRREPGQSLLAMALQQLRRHPEIQTVFSDTLAPHATGS